MGSSSAVQLIAFKHSVSYNIAPRRAVSYQTYPPTHQIILNNFRPNEQRYDTWYSVLGCGVIKTW